LALFVRDKPLTELGSLSSKKYRLQDTTECHAAILKDWMRNDAFLPDQDVDVLRLKYDDAYMGDYEHGFHDLCFRQDMFIRYIKQGVCTDTNTPIGVCPYTLIKIGCSTLS
ncbi:hypothetical protein, partial [Faecalibaculum rodentium]|uniref:hypothetical protein n=3 Tax=Faecalibaculum rodentium TaxID=1702221 RepID=UPI00256F116D